MSDCNIVNVNELPYPFKQVLTSFMDNRFVNGYGFEGQDWSFGFDIDFDPEVRANWVNPELGSLNTDSNMFHELISQEVDATMSLIIRRLFHENTIPDKNINPLYVDAVSASHEEPYEPFGTYYWNEKHTTIDDETKQARIDFITRGHVGISIIAEEFISMFEDELGEAESEERIYLIPMELAGYLTVIEGQREGVGESTLTLSLIDDGIVNMRSMTPIWECIQ